MALLEQWEGVVHAGKQVVGRGQSGDSLLIAVVFSVTSLFGSENGGSGGSGDWRLEKAGGRSVSKWTREV